MKRLILALGAMFMAMSFAVPGVADEKNNTADNKTIEQKKVAIQKILSQGKFKAYIQKDEKFCAAFLDDFTKQKGIEYIKPIVEVNDYNDPKLQDYFKQCPNKDFHKTAEISHARTLQEIAGKEQMLGRSLSDEELEEYGGIDFYATKNFKLYKVNIDNDAKNGDEYVLYAEGFYNDIINRYTYGGYRIIDLQQCRFRGGVSSNDPFDYKNKKPIENYNGIIKYMGEYYVFDLYKDPAPAPAPGLALEKYNKKRGNMNVTCRYYGEK